MKPTIHDVAKLAGVSITTVSLVLNNKPSRISDATRKRVISAARELQFIPNVKAVSLATGNFSSVGIIVPDIRNVFFAALCAACEEEAYKTGHTVLFGSSGDSSYLTLDYVKNFVQQGAAGIILVKAANTSDDDEQELVDYILKSPIPFITVDRKIKDPNIRSIVVDQKKGAYIATKHLIFQGHRNIGCITGPSPDVVTTQRILGYKQALEEAGIPFCSDIVCEGDYSIDCGREYLPYLLGKFVTAIFCFNDMMAMGVYSGCRNYNMKIPESLSVIGFDDIPFCETLEIPLTSIHQPAEKIGKTAMQELLKLINNTGKARDYMFDPHLKLRASTAPLIK